DGFADLAVGVPGEDVGSVALAGAVHVLYGGPGGLSSAGDQVFHQDSPDVNDTAENGDEFGFAVTSGDLDADGFADLAVGVSNVGVGSVASAGAVHVMYGGPGGLSAAGDQVFHQDSPGVNDTAEGFDNFGRTLTSGDFDSDGLADLAVGVPFEDVGSISDAGAVQVLYGGPAGLSSAGDQVFHQDSPGVNDTAEAGDNFAAALVDSAALHSP
ncbi:MAG: FG-GAP repeat protein, partial [Actinomycetota bacterium]